MAVEATVITEQAQVPELSLTLEGSRNINAEQQGGNGSKGSHCLRTVAVMIEEVTVSRVKQAGGRS